MMKHRGFTIVELLIVIVVIAILAAITIVAYTGIQERTANAKIMNDLKSLQKVIESYKSVHGEYPSTSGWMYSSVNPSGFIPLVAAHFNTSLPQLSNKGPVNINNCYIYRSNGTDYKVMRLGQGAHAFSAAERDAIPDSMKDGYNGSDRYGFWSSGAYSF